MAIEHGSSPVPPCELLEWDSEHFDFPIARVRAGELTQSSMDEVDAWCLDRGVRCLYFSADGDEPETARVAAAHGFRVVDVRVVAPRRGVPGGGRWGSPPAGPMKAFSSCPPGLRRSR